MTNFQYNNGRKLERERILGHLNYIRDGYRFLWLDAVANDEPGHIAQYAQSVIAMDLAILVASGPGKALAYDPELKEKIDSYDWGVLV